MQRLKIKLGVLGSRIVAPIPPITILTAIWMKWRVTLRIQTGV